MLHNTSRVLRALFRKPVIQDAGMGLALLGATLLMFSPGDTSAALGGGTFVPPLDPLWLMAALAAVVGVTFRRRLPLLMLVLCVLSAGAHMALGAPGTFVDLAAPILVGTIAATRSRRLSVPVLIVIVAASTVWGITVSYAGQPDEKLPDVIRTFTSVTAVEHAPPPAPDSGDLPDMEYRKQNVDSNVLPTAWGGFPVLGSVLVAAWAIGSRTRTRKAYLDELRARADDLERERDQRAALAVAAERGRISRELHDVVAHGLSVMVVQAQGGAAALDKRPTDTRDALAAIVDTGRRALADMRRALAAVGSVGDAWEPPPGLAQLPQLVERLRTAGTPVELHVEGEPVTLPSTVDLSAYRIAQEALTNVVKHAGPDARAQVLLTYDAQNVSIEVNDDGTASPTMDTHGNGLRGMRERAELLGGSLQAGRRLDKGFTVRARLPIERESE